MKILVPLSEGFEEMEAVILIDILRRGGVDAVTAATGESLFVCGGHGIEIAADALWDDIAKEDFDGIAIPGGMGGTRRNQADDRVLAKVAELHRAGRLVAAICAGPLVLKSAGILDADAKVTCYPGLDDELEDTKRQNGFVVTDGNVVTSQGPGTSFAFALALLRRLRGDAVADDVRDGALVQS